MYKLYKYALLKNIVLNIIYPGKVKTFIFINNRIKNKKFCHYILNTNKC